MPSRISIQENQFLDINIATFRDVQKRLGMSTDMLFVTDKSKIIGVITYADYIRGRDSDLSDIGLSDIVNREYLYLYEDQLKQSAYIFSGTNIVSIPVFNKETEEPLYVLRRSDYCENQSFYCSCLTGQSTYFFSINSDLSVSCDCMLRESGELGNLKDSTINAIFHSSRADNIRQNLCLGYLMSSRCLICSCLIAAPQSLCEHYRTNYSFPKGIMLETTSLCNYTCVNCYNALIDKDTISVDDIENIAKQLAKEDIKVVHLFKLGEPFADPEFSTKVDILKCYLPHTQFIVSTNGALLDCEAHIRSALMLDAIVFSIDGSDDETLTRYQRGGNYSRAINNMKRLIEARELSKQASPVIVWKFVLFAWNDSNEVIDAAFEEAIRIGVDRLEFFQGGNVRYEEISHAISKSKCFLKYMDIYEFQAFNIENGDILKFDLKAKK